jgi:hypothetical protein
VPDWYWEGNVQARIGAWLERGGWTVESMADTATRQQGVDIVATWPVDRRRFLIEVKGFPSTVYQRGPKAGQRKPTLPATQARVWFSGALLSGLLMLDREPTALVALGFPEFGTYSSLVNRTSASLRRVGLGVIMVRESGEVIEVLPVVQR